MVIHTQVAGKLVKQQSFDEFELNEENQPVMRAVSQQLDTLTCSTGLKQTDDPKMLIDHPFSSGLGSQLAVRANKGDLTRWEDSRNQLIMLPQ